MQAAQGAIGAVPVLEGGALTQGEMPRKANNPCSRKNYCVSSNSPSATLPLCTHPVETAVLGPVAPVYRRGHRLGDGAGGACARGRGQRWRAGHAGRERASSPQAWLLAAHAANRECRWPARCTHKPCMRTQAMHAHVNAPASRRGESPSCRTSASSRRAHACSLQVSQRGPPERQASGCRRFRGQPKRRGAKQKAFRTNEGRASHLPTHRNRSPTAWPGGM